ncbi:unnamed protein product, partial [Didymodactylos carnosus]
DFSQNDYIVNCMRQIDSCMMQYTSSVVDDNEEVDELIQNEQVEYYLKYLKLYRNDEKRVQQCLSIFCESQAASINTSIIGSHYLNEIVPLVEHFPKNEKIALYSLELLQKVLANDQDEYFVQSSLVSFIRKMIPQFENEITLILKLITILNDLALKGKIIEIYNNKNESDFVLKDVKFGETKIVADIIRILNKYNTDVGISSKCCILLWQLRNEPSSLRDLHQNRVSILNALLNLLEKLGDNVDIFTKVCFAFMPLLLQTSIVDYLAQYNIVRYFTIGLQKHLKNRNAVKSGS